MPGELLEAPEEVAEEVMKIIAREKSTFRLSPSVKVALSRMPSNRFHSASLAFSISSNSTKLIFIVSVWYWFSASWLSSGCVSRWPRYPGGEPISFAISWLCWNSAQSILITARGFLPAPRQSPRRCGFYRNRSAPGRGSFRSDARERSSR